MLLAVDVGNTHTVLGCYDGETLRRTWRVSSQGVGTADELRAQLNMLFADEGIAPKEFESIVVSSVVPRITSVLREAYADADLGSPERRGPLLKVIDHKWPWSFRIEASPPEQIGADRLVNAEAALRDYGAPLIIIDSGTATTLCAVSGGNGKPAAYLGGAIMPGMELSLEALAKRAAKLFSIELIAPEKAIGPNTQQALRSGILLGYAGMIDSMVARFREELAARGCEKPRVIATGGVSQRLKGLLREADIHDPELTLRGIRYLYESVRDL